MCPIRIKICCEHLSLPYDDELSIFCSVLHIMPHNRNILEICHAHEAYKSMEITRKLRIKIQECTTLHQKITQSSINFIHHIKGCGLIVMKSKYESQ